MDLNKLNFINQEEQSSAKPRRRNRAKSKPIRRRSHRKTPLRALHKSNDTYSGITHQSKPTYKNIRLESNTAFQLQAMQEVTGDRSRSSLIARMLKMVDPIILNSTTKKRKYNHDLRLLRKRDEIIKELNHKM